MTLALSRNIKENTQNKVSNEVMYLKGRCSAARTSAYFPLDMISLLKPIFSYSFPRLNFPTNRKSYANYNLQNPKVLSEYEEKGMKTFDSK